MKPPDGLISRREEREIREESPGLSQVEEDHAREWPEVWVENQERERGVMEPKRAGPRVIST